MAVGASKASLYVAFGSNLSGDNGESPLQLMEKAIAAVGRLPELKYLSSSNLYQTEPTEGCTATFLNCVIRYELDIGSGQNMGVLLNNLLARCLGIELALYRKRPVPGVRVNRTIDIDFISVIPNNAIDCVRINTETVVLPHPRAHLRTFVLYPLQDVASKSDKLLETSGSLFTVEECLKGSADLSCQVTKCWALSESRWHTIARSTMHILNVTPDSFSEKYPVIKVTPEGEILDEEALAELYVNEEHLLCDLGPESTRPGAQLDLSPEREIARLRLALDHLEAQFGGDLKPSFSIDTRFREVFEYCSKRLPHCSVWNNQAAVALDQKDLEWCVTRKITLIYMYWHKYTGTEHARSISEQAPNYSDIFKSVSERWFAAGGLRWRLVLDPGLGFNIHSVNACRVLKQVDDVLQDLKVPMLLGFSRKSFICKYVGEVEGAQIDDPQEATDRAVLRFQDQFILRLHQTPTGHP